VATHRVIAAPVTVEVPRIKGSRFIADVARVRDEEEARAHAASVRAQHHAARHVCWAFRVGEDGALSRFSDDGEPSGSAGRPILAAIDGAGLTFVSVTVTRYFGGTKLGVGELVRAYGGAAAEGLAEAGVTVVVPTRTVRCVLPYGLLGALETFCVHEGVDRPEPTYADSVTFGFAIPEDDAEGFAARLVEATRGGAVVTVSAA
jgi:uncharacterized YigZ family protein